MARRKQGIAEDVMDLTSRVPWWVGVVLASLSFVYLETISSILQWFLPALFLVAAAVSFLKQRRRASRNVAVDGARRALAQMSWQEVEEVVGEYFRRRDFSVTDTERAGPDGGFDLVLTKRDEYYLVHCKRWRAVTVGVETVRELLVVMAARHAVGGFVVTSGSFSVEAGKFAENREIELIDGEQLQGVIATQAERAARVAVRVQP
jgi:restriction system protein